MRSSLFHCFGLLGLWNSFYIYSGEILLTFDGTTLVKGMFYQRFDAECLTSLLWHLMTPQMVGFYWRYGISKFAPYSDLIPAIFRSFRRISQKFAVVTVETKVSTFGRDVKFVLSLPFCFKGDKQYGKRKKDINMTE